MTIVEWLFGPKNEFMSTSRQQPRLDRQRPLKMRKNCEESDMTIPAGLYEALREHRAARTWQLTSGTHAVNLVLQILETR
ncbi:hypothetical protein ACIPL1_23805 [Pseudomonas sp. NPDC090202]|uniref:hypothetical protein n=1 Tax=unclassified Pseudomonas TaxID=196821 RepID=UPI003818B729